MYVPIANAELSPRLGGADQQIASAHDAGDKTPTQPPVVHYGNVEREPKNEVTDPSLFEKGMVSRGRIRATPGDTEVLDSGQCCGFKSIKRHDLTCSRLQAPIESKEVFCSGEGKSQSAYERIMLSSTDLPYLVARTPWLSDFKRYSYYRWQVR